MKYTHNIIIHDDMMYKSKCVIVTAIQSKKGYGSKYYIYFWRNLNQNNPHTHYVG